MKKAIFPGTFDPITLGHVEIVIKGLELFDEIVIAIGVNAQKKHLFDLIQRKEWIQKVFQNYPEVSVMEYNGLTVEFCKSINARFILRGLRSGSDFEYEQPIAFANKELENDIETVFILSSPSLNNISSSIVRDVIINKGNYKKFVPKEVIVD